MTTVPDLPPVVTVSKRKLRGGRACWNAYQIDRDVDGVWLFTPAGSRFRSSDGHRDEECEVEGIIVELDGDLVRPHPTPRRQCRDLWVGPARRPGDVLR